MGGTGKVIQKERSCIDLIFWPGVSVRLQSAQSSSRLYSLEKNARKGGVETSASRDSMRGCRSLAGWN